MYSRDFAFWLQGFFEISDAKELTEEQTTMIKKHLNLVFKHEIDDMYEGNKEELQNIHDGTLSPDNLVLTDDSSVFPNRPGKHNNDTLYRC